MSERLIYLDNNSTTKVDDRVLAVMLPYFTEYYGNAASAHHFGMKINKAVTDARGKIASFINAQENEIVFTSGATESLNLALKGLAFSSDKRKHLITTSTEHKAVLDTCIYLESIGFEISYLPINSEGILDLDLLQNEIRDDTLAICVMWVNNETGIINQIENIGRIARDKGILFLSDATQAIGKLPINVVSNNIDLLVFSAHKFYGPKGIGAIFINNKTVHKSILTTLQHGGGHENGFRSGTLNVPGIIGFGETCEIAKTEMRLNQDKIELLQDFLENELLNIDGCIINGSKEHRLYNTINFRLPNFDANVFIGLNKNIAVSNGSACTSAIVEPSYVLKAMGISNVDAFASIRVSIGKWNEKKDILTFIDLIKSFQYL